MKWDGPQQTHYRNEYVAAALIVALALFGEGIGNALATLLGG